MRAVEFTSVKSNPENGINENNDDGDDLDNLINIERKKTGCKTSLFITYKQILFCSYIDNVHHR